MIDQKQNRPRFSIAALFVFITLVSILLALFLSFYPFGPLLAWLAAAGMVMVAGKRYRSEKSIGPFVGCSIWMICIGLLCLPIFVSQAHCVPPHRLEKLRMGSIPAEVIAKIGKPSHVRSLTEGGQEWRYSTFTWCIVRVIFDEAGNVEYVDHDH